MTEIKLRDYQQTAVDAIRAEFGARRFPVLFVLPTGGGKTYTFSYIAANAARLANSVCIIVHRKELLLQASAALAALGIPHGMISPHFTPNPRERVQVASVDTLLSRLKTRSYKFTMLIFDEAHHVVADNKWGRAYALLGKPATLGVTATPVRSDTKGLGDHAGGIFKSMVLGPSVADLIQRGMLINPTVYTSLEVPDLSDVATNADGDYNAQQLAAAVDKPKITGSAVEHYTKICPGQRAIAFCATVEHARHVVEQFNAAGYRFALLVGEPAMSDAERTSVNARLRSGELHGACTVDLVSEGYDLPDLAVCIMLRPTASEGLFLQQVGRAMRPSPGKTQCWLLDHVGNVGAFKDGEFKRKHGLPNEIREWSLDGKKKRKKGAAKPEDDVKIKQCPKCFFVHEPAPSCPACGLVYPVNTREIEQVDGQLREITADMQADIGAAQRRIQGSARTVDEMVARLGYSRGRAEAIVRAREEKSALVDSIKRDLQDWRRSTGQDPLDAFGVHLDELKTFKPKALKELREKFDAHRERHGWSCVDTILKPSNHSAF